MPTPQQEQGAPPPSSGRRLALVVGVNGPSVAGRAALQYATDDGRDMAQALSEPACGFSLFKSPFLGEEATTANVREAVLDLADQLRDDDLALFYFSGHGEVMPIGADLDDVYLVTHDFNPARIKRDKNAHLSMRWLRQVLFEHEQAHTILLMLDCCYAGTLGAIAPDLYLDELQQRLRYYFDAPSAQSPSRPDGIRLALTATGPTTTALEKDGHGLMTGLLLPALHGEVLPAVNDEGSITFNRLVDYLSDNMPVERRPHYYGAGGTLILAMYPHLSAQARREREQTERRAEREQRLRTMCADHSGFLQDRLASFVGREQELAQFHQQINALLPVGGYLTITGHPGQGKSSIMAKLIEAYSQEQGGLERVAYHFIPLTPGPDHQVVLLRNLMARLILKYGLSDLALASESRSTLSEAFPRLLKEIADKGWRELIFIDGLDQLDSEQTGQRDLSFLPQGFGNPPHGIVFVLATRPNDTLHLLELLKPHKLYSLPNLNRADFDLILRHRGVTLARHVADQFYHALDENALYLDLVAKELAARGTLPSMEIEDIIRHIADKPENLFSLALERLKQPPALWEKVIKPTLGLLLVVGEPIGRQQLKQLINLSTPAIDSEQLNRGLDRLGGLVVTDEQQRYTLFHFKFRDFLRRDPQHLKKQYIFDAEDEQHWHQRFIAWCEQSGLTHLWSESQEETEQVRRHYARQHYITHLYQAHAWDKLFAVLDEGSYGRAKIQYDSTGMPAYALDLDLGRKAATSKLWSLDEAIQHLPHLWRYTLLRYSLASRADRYPLPTFQLMALLGKETKALGLAELLTAPGKKASAFALIAFHLAKQPGREREAEKLLIQAGQTITALSDEASRIGALKVLGQCLEPMRDKKRVKPMWQEAERPIAVLPNETIRAKAAKELKVILAGQKTDTSELAALITDPTQRMVVLTGIAYRMFYMFPERHDEARQLLEQAKQAIASLPDEASRKKALAEQERVSKQVSFWQPVEPKWQDAERVIATLPDEALRARTMEELRSASAQVWEARKGDDEFLSTQVQAELLIELGTALEQEGHRQEAMRAWQDAEQIITTFHHSFGVSTRLNLALAAHRWQDAERIVTLISDKIMQAQALTEVGSALALAGLRQDAERLVNTLEQFLISLPIYEERDREQVVLKLSKKVGLAGRWQDAERVIWSIADSAKRAEALCELGVALARAHQQERAKAMWTEAEQVIRSIGTDYQRDDALCELGIALAQAQQWVEAERVIRSIGTDYQRDDALCELGVALAHQQGRAKAIWVEAERVIRSIGTDYQQNEALYKLGIAQAEALAQIGLWSDAERVIATIAHEGWQVQGLIMLGKMLEQASRLSDALRIVSDAERASVDSESLHSEALVRRAIVLGRMGYLQQAEQDIVAIRNVYTQISVLIELILALGQVGRWQEAGRFWIEAEHLISSSSAQRSEEDLKKLASALEQANRRQDAERVIAMLPDEASKIQALIQLGSRLKQVGRTQEAHQRWQQAEEAITSISGKKQEETITSISGKEALVLLANALAQQNERQWLLNLVYHWWRQADTRDTAIELLPLAFDFISLHPEIGLAFYDAFAWVDNFLRG